MANVKDITGQRFGRLVALYPTGERRYRKVVWRFRCDCGNKIDCVINNLRYTQSCGCLHDELSARRAYRHGESQRSSLYNCWNRIKQKCFNPKHKDFKYYGARGITMWAAWINDFVAFRGYVNQTLGPRPKDQSLDRINNYGNYEPNNLKWSTPSEQTLNSWGSKRHKELEALMREDTL